MLEDSGGFIFLLIAIAVIGGLLWLFSSSTPEYLETRIYCDGTRVVVIEDDDNEDVIYMDRGVYESLVKKDTDYEGLKEWHVARMQDDSAYKTQYDRIFLLTKDSNCGYQVTDQLTTPSGYIYRSNPGGFRGGK